MRSFPIFFLSIVNIFIINMLVFSAAAYGVPVESDDANDITLTENTTYTVAEGGSYTFSGVISGAYGITLDGAGALNLTGNNTYSGGSTVSNGTLKVLADLGASASSTYKPLGAGTVTLGENGTLLWAITTSNADGSANALTNTITGNGTLRMQMGPSKGNTMFGLNSKLSNFTGTIELANNTRLEWSAGENAELNKVTAIRIENGSEFWTSGATPILNSNFILNGTGAGAGGDSAQRGVFRLNTSATFRGTTTLESDSLFGMASNNTARFLNDADLAGHTLYTANTVDAGGKIIFSGDVTAGTINNRKQFYSGGGSGTSTVALQFATSAEAGYAKNQNIAAAIQQNNTSTAMVFEPAEGYTITADGVISGEGAVTKEGAGTLIIGALDTFSGGLTINAGTVSLKNDLAQETRTSKTVTSRTYQAGTGRITVNENGTFIWYNQNSDDVIPNTVAGSGKVIIDAMHSTTSNYGGNYGIGTNFTGFTGTLELQNHARVGTNSLGGTTNLIINSGNMAWFTGGNQSAALTISGDGAGAGGDSTGRGAVGASNSVTLSGKITLAADAYIGIRDTNPVLTLAGDIETAGHSLKMSQNYQSGGVINMKGNVLSTVAEGAALGTVNFAGVGSTTVYSANIGDLTAAESAAVQTIAANLNYSNTTAPLTFLAGENRTIAVQGRLTGTGGVALVKEGAGSLTFADSTPITGTLTVNGGSVTLSPGTYNTSSTEAGFQTGLTAITVNNGAEVNLNASGMALTAVNVAEGTLNANYRHRNIGGTQYQSIANGANITVGSEAGGTALLTLTQKACGDHGGSVTIYDGGTIQMKGADISFGGSKGITFIGGGAVTSTPGAYFNFRGNGNQCFKVEGADAHASIAANITMYDSGLGSVNVVDADSSLLISGSITQGHSAALGFRKYGAGTLILTSGNQYRQLQIYEGTVEFSGNGDLTPCQISGVNYGVNVSVADGASLVIKNSCNFTSGRTPAADYPSTFTMNDGASLIIDGSHWTLTPTIEAALTAGTLGGSGTIFGNIDTNGLTISPGNGKGDIQTLTVNGDLTLNAGSFKFEIGANSEEHDMLNVTGAVNLTDVTVTLAQAAATSDIKLGDTIRLMTLGELGRSSFAGLNLASEILLPYANGRWDLQIRGNDLVALAGNAEMLPEPGAWLLLLLGAAMMLKGRKRFSASVQTAA